MYWCDFFQSETTFTEDLNSTFWNKEKELKPEDSYSDFVKFLSSQDVFSTLMKSNNKNETGRIQEKDSIEDYLEQIGNIC